MSSKKYHTVKTMDERNSIRIGLVGCVSCGKSTLLNSICVNQYEEMKKCRTTMLPSVYKETNHTIHNNKQERRKILFKNAGNNQKIFSGEVKLSNENCKVVENMIPKINDFTNLPQNIYHDIYDIPGLNDAETKDIYYKWIEDNFSELDIIVHIIDINSPLNTSDQIDILKMLIKNIHNEKTKNGRDVLLLTLVNKCDEMDSVGEGEFEMDEEDQKNYDNIIKTTYEKIKEVTGEDTKNTARRSGKMKKELIHCEFTPISAADTFVYRMLHNDPTVEMDMKLLQKFGVNEVGRRTWNKMDEKGKRKMISEHFSQVDISDTLEITGYNRFTSIMKDYLTKEKQSKILINRIKHELSNEELINKNISTDKEELQKLIDIYNSYCSKVWVIDKLYKTNNSQIITDLINQHISRWINQVSDLSNESAESVKRLQEYKEIIKLLCDSIDTYALLNGISMNIDESKTKRWSASFGISEQTASAVAKSGKFTIKNTLNYLVGGYSKLQNAYYLTKLEDDSTYEEFPKCIFENIDALRNNAYDSVKSTIDNVITRINNIISNVDWVHRDKSPLCGYYEITKENTIVEFCKTLLNSYNYPKEKVIEFLKNYLLNRYLITRRKIASGTTLSNHPFYGITSPKEDYVEKAMFINAYTIVFDYWLMEHVSGHSEVKEYDKFLKNLYYINRSFINVSYFDERLNYCGNEERILAIPTYMYSLMVEKKERSEERKETNSDSEEYSSAEEEN